MTMSKVNRAQTFKEPPQRSARMTIMRQQFTRSLPIPQISIGHLSGISTENKRGPAASLQTCLSRDEELDLLVMETYLEKHDPERNQARYYRMSVTSNLFGEWTLEREWGRIGQGRRSRLDLFRSEAEAERALIALEVAKQRRAYKQVIVCH